MGFQGGVMPQGHSQSPHTTRISRVSLSPSLSNSTTFHVCGPAFYYFTINEYINCSTSSGHHPQGEGTVLRVGSQTLEHAGTLGLLQGGGALWRPCHTIADAAELCGWASASPQNQSFENKGPYGDTDFPEINV